MNNHKFLSFVGGITLGMIIVCLGTCLALNLLSPSEPRPSDKQLTDNYQQHRVEFQELAQMLLQEADLSVIYPKEEHCQTKNQQIITAADNQRCADYVKRFKQLGLDWSHSGTKSLWLRVFSEGSIMAGEEKGYLYTNESLSPLAESTDDFQGKRLPLYRQIDDKWYIYFDGE
jgi:hypothetical protein